MPAFPQSSIGTAHRLVALLIAVLLVGAACGADQEAPSGAESAAPRTEQEQPAGQSPVEEPAATDSQPGSTGDRSPLADRIKQLPPAPTGLPTPPPPARKPVGLTIESLGVDVATVIGVGVEDNGDMEIPPADEVGWYRYGPTPGAAGASVLAAHIAYNGANGVFVNLDDLELGSLITVTYDDDTTADFEAVTKEQYDKSELPTDEVWGRDGDPRLVLITCGGDFNRRVSSYEDNIVVYANPVLDQS